MESNFEHNKNLRPYIEEEEKYNKNILNTKQYSFINNEDINKKNRSKSNSNSKNKKKKNIIFFHFQLIKTILKNVLELTIFQIFAKMKT